MSAGDPRLAGPEGSGQRGQALGERREGAVGKHASRLVWIAPDG